MKGREKCKQVNNKPYRKGLLYLWMLVTAFQSFAKKKVQKKVFFFVYTKALQIIKWLKDYK